MGLDIKTTSKDNTTSKLPFADRSANPSRPDYFWDKTSYDGFPFDRARIDNSHLVNKILTEVTKVRDQALSRLMNKHGLNIDQVSMLKLNDINLKERKLTVTPYSGARSYPITLTDDTIEAIRAYLRVRSPSRRNELFLTENFPANNHRSDLNTTLRITPENLRGEDINHATRNHT